MVENVLPIAGTVSHTAQQLDHSGWMPCRPVFHHRTLSVLLDLRVHFLARLFHHLFDSCRMNSSVLYQALQRDSRNLAAHRVHGWKGDGLGGIVDDKVDARQCFQGSDVAALASDDASLHLIVGQRHYRNGNLGNLSAAQRCMVWEMISLAFCSDSSFKRSS